MTWVCVLPHWVTAASERCSSGWALKCPVHCIISCTAAANASHCLSLSYSQPQIHRATGVLDQDHPLSLASTISHVLVMAAFPPRQPPQNDDDDLSSLLSRTFIQNSPHWPSVGLPSPGPSVRTLNQSDAGSYPDDLSSLANFSCEDLDYFSDRGSVFVANISRSPFSSRPSTPSSDYHERYQLLSPESLSDKRPDQPVLAPLVLSSCKSTIGSISEFQVDSSYNSVSLPINNPNKDLPHQSVIADVVPVPPRPSTPNGDTEDRNKYSSEDHQLVSTDATYRRVITLSWPYSTRSVLTKSYFHKVMQLMPCLRSRHGGCVRSSPWDRVPSSMFQVHRGCPYLPILSTSFTYFTGLRGCRRSQILPY